MLFYFPLAVQEFGHLHLHLYLRKSDRKKGCLQGGDSTLEAREGFKAVWSSYARITGAHTTQHPDETTQIHLLCLLRDWSPLATLVLFLSTLAQGNLNPISLTLPSLLVVPQRQLLLWKRPMRS